MSFFYKGKEIPAGGGLVGLDGNPIGTIISFMGTAAPKSYLVCDGAEYSVNKYPELAEFFQEQFGAKNHFGGDGTTTFTVPDLRDRFILGAGGTYSVGSTGGEETHTLTAEEMPEHNHDSAVPDTGSYSFKIGIASGAKYNAETAPTTSTGGNQPHNNMPPYYALMM